MPTAFWDKCDLSRTSFNCFFPQFCVKVAATSFMELLAFFYLLITKTSIIFFINLFIYLFWLRWVFIAVYRLSLVVVSGGYSSLCCAGFSLLWLVLLQSSGSSHTGFSSCGTQAQ